MADDDFPDAVMRQGYQAQATLTATSNTRVRQIIADMQAASDAVDDANGTSDYQMRLIDLALIARYYLRVLAAHVPSSPEQAKDLSDPMHAVFTPSKNRDEG